MNMEMTGTSRVADTRLPTADSNAGDTNPELNDFPSNSREEPSRDDNITAGDEEAADARATTNYELPIGSAFNNGATEKHEEHADSSHNPQEIVTPKDHKTEPSEGTTEDANSPNVSQSPLAFTIDFGSSKEVDKTKYQNLFERYNARHRRNLSMSKV